MAYSNKFVVSIIHDGDICSEREDSVVSLPFGAEYGVRLRNKHNRRASALVKIDGETIGDFVVPANSFVDILRWADKNKALKFVAKDSGEAKSSGKDLTSHSNGVVEVKFRLEKDYNAHAFWKSPSPWTPFWYGYSYTSNTGNVEGVVMPSFTVSNKTEQTCSINSVQSQNNDNFEAEVKTIGVIQPPLQDGITVEGDKTSQEFTEVYFTTEDVETIIRLFLKGYVGPIRGKNKYCTGCGKSRGRKEDKYCGECGQKL